MTKKSFRLIIIAIKMKSHGFLRTSCAKTILMAKGEIMKKLLTLIVAALMSITCVFGLVGCSDDNGKPTLQVYTNAGFAPYEYVNEFGEVVGVDIDIMKEVGEVLGYNVVINDIEFDQILVEVEKSELAIGAAGMTETDERNEIALPSIQYAKSVQYVIVKADAFEGKEKLTLADLKTLGTKAIGVQEGTTGDFLVSDAISGTEDDNGQHVAGELENAGFSRMGYTNAIVASQDIGTTLGAVVIDKLPAESICKGNTALKCLELDAEPENYVLYFNKAATELRDKVNKVLEKIIAGGVIDFYTLKHSGGII